MRARGKLYKDGTWWRYEVWDKHGTIVLDDCCSSFWTLYHQLRHDVAAVRIIEAAGHRLRPYADLVAETMAGKP